MNDGENRRILLVDDNQSIHDDFRKILAAKRAAGGKLDAARAAFGSGESPPEPGDGASAAPADQRYEIDSALQGEEALERLRSSLREERPYAVAFVDVRMPPGWDGVRTVEALWKEDQELQTVICTAYSDYSWAETIARLGYSDRLLILKKPFDAVEIQQLASALTRKWDMARRERALVRELSRAEQEARAYASSLETANRALSSAKAAADQSSQIRARLLAQLGEEFHAALARISGGARELCRPGALSAEMLAKVEGILETGGELTETLDEVLELTRMESGESRVENAPFAPLDAVERVAATWRAPAERKDLVLRVEPAGALPRTVESDRARFEAILSELVGNAVRCTASGEVRLRVRLEQREDWRRPLLRCDVIDGGSGLSADARTRLFEPCVGRSSGAAEGEIARGLGLAVARQGARLLGGDLTLEECSSEGTTFRLTVDAGDLSEVELVG